MSADGATLTNEGDCRCDALAHGWGSANLYANSANGRTYQYALHSQGHADTFADAPPNPDQHPGYTHQHAHHHPLTAAGNLHHRNAGYQTT